MMKLSRCLLVRSTRSITSSVMKPQSFAATQNKVGGPVWSPALRAAPRPQTSAACSMWHNSLGQHQAVLACYMKRGTNASRSASLPQALPGLGHILWSRTVIPPGCSTTELSLEARATSALITRGRVPPAMVCGATSAGAMTFSSNGPGPSGPATPGVGFQSELHTVNVAIVANMLIFVAKMAVWTISGSSAMLAEGIHSLADVGNQVLLRTGVMKAKQSPTLMYPYGFTRDKFVWSLISAVGIFCCGAGVSFLHGVHGLFEERVVEHLFWNLVVLGVSALLEGYSLWVAARTVLAGAAAKGLGAMDYIKRGMDPTSTAVLLEDGGAVAGLAIAGVCTVLTHATGNVMWDSLGSIAIGFLLGSIAIFLIQRNRSMLIGRSMNPTEMSRIMEHLRNDTVVRHVFDAKSEEIGPGLYRFKAEIEWQGDLVVERYLKRCGRESLHSQLRSAVLGGQQDKLDGVLKAYGKDIISAVGVEVDRLEAEIVTLNPGVQYVDLETDRGKFERGTNSMSSLDGDFCYVKLSDLDRDLGGEGPPVPKAALKDDSALWTVANSMPHKNNRS